MTSLNGTVTLDDNAKIVDKRGKLYGSDNLSYISLTLTVYVLDTINDAVPIYTHTPVTGYVTYNKSKGYVNMTVHPFQLPVSATSYGGKILGITWADRPELPTNVASALGTIICTEPSSGKAAIGSVGLVFTTTPLNLHLSVLTSGIISSLGPLNFAMPSIKWTTSTLI